MGFKSWNGSSLAWVKMAVVGPSVSVGEMVNGWAYGFTNISSKDLFHIAGIWVSGVMPHNLYLHTASLQPRRVLRREEVVRQAVIYFSSEPVLPTVLSFCCYDTDAVAATCDAVGLWVVELFTAIFFRWYLSQRHWTKSDHRKSNLPVPCPSKKMEAPTVWMLE